MHEAPPKFNERSLTDRHVGEVDYVLRHDWTGTGPFVIERHEVVAVCGSRDEAVAWMRSRPKEDRWATAGAFVVADAGERLAVAVEQYLLWAPCKRGHADAHRALLRAYNDYRAVVPEEDSDA